MCYLKLGGHELVSPSKHMRYSPEFVKRQQKFEAGLESFKFRLLGDRSANCQCSGSGSAIGGV